METKVARRKHVSTIQYFRQERLSKFSKILSISVPNETDTSCQYIFYMKLK